MCERARERPCLSQSMSPSLCFCCVCLCPCRRTRDRDTGGVSCLILYACRCVSVHSKLSLSPTRSMPYLTLDVDVGQDAQVSCQTDSRQAPMRDGKIPDHRETRYPSFKTREAEFDSRPPMALPEHGMLFGDDHPLFSKQHTLASCLQPPKP